MPPSLAVRLCLFVLAGASSFAPFCFPSSLIASSSSSSSPRPLYFLRFVCAMHFSALLTFKRALGRARSSQLTARSPEILGFSFSFLVRVVCLKGYIYIYIYVCGIYHTHIFTLTYILLFASTLPAAGILIRKTNILRNSRSPGWLELAQVSFMRFNAGI